MTRSKHPPTTLLRNSVQRLIDSRENAWNFEGCTITGPATQRSLKKINFLKDFWFDWKNYHPQTTVYGR
jgi:hypothetical protein